MNERDEKLAYNYMIELKKKKVNQFERAKLIQEYLDKREISIRQLSSETAIPPSTLQDYLLYNRLTDEQYDMLKERGFSDTEIYRLLRNNKDDLDAVLNAKKEDLLVYTLETYLDKVRKVLKEYVRDETLMKRAKTQELLKDIQKLIKQLKGKGE